MENKNDHSNLSYRNSIKNTGSTVSLKNSREPSPESGTKGIRVYPRVSNYGKTGSSSKLTKKKTFDIKNC